MTQLTEFLTTTVLPDLATLTADPNEDGDSENGGEGDNGDGQDSNDSEILDKVISTS